LKNCEGAGRKAGPFFVGVEICAFLCHIVGMTGKLAQTRRVGRRSGIGVFLTLGEALNKQMADTAVGDSHPLHVRDLEASWSPRFADEEIEHLVIPRRTLARRKASAEPLSLDETDRAIRLARVQTEADRVFANQEKASLWLRSPNHRISGQTPLSLLRTEAGALTIVEILGQIDHGMYA
jgi:putative toxin-antitoxin system antitoxin component (TIGR02293 family)